MSQWGSEAPVAVTENTKILTLLDFTGKSNAPLITGYTSDIGGAITMGGAGGADIVNGYAVPTITNVYYANVDAGQTINKTTIEFALEGTVTSWIPSLTISHGIVSAGVAEVLHLQFTPTGFTLMVRMAGAITDGILSGQWNQRLKSDGTVYRVELSSYGNRVKVSGPFGESFTQVDNRILQVAGNKAFFEAEIESNGSYPKIKRFYVTGTSNTNTPSANKLPSEIELPTGINGNSAGNIGFNCNTYSEVSFGGGALGAPTISFGPIRQTANLMSAITAGATTFQSDQKIPNGTYTFDPVSSQGTLVETRTVTANAGASAPYTITVSAAFTNNHAAGITLTANASSAQTSIFLSQFGNLTLPANTVVSGNLRVGGDGYSTTLSQAATNYMQLLDAGPASPTSFGVTGGFRIVEGANRFANVATLVAGTVTVSNTRIAAGDRITLNRQGAGGTLGELSVGTIIAGTSFVINSASITDTSVIYWEIRRPG